MARRRITFAVAALACVAAALGTSFARADLPAGAHVVAAIPVGVGNGMIDVGFGSVWVANGGSGTVSRIDPATNTVVASVPVGQGIVGVRTGDGGVWVTNPAANTLTRIDPATNTVAATIPVGVLPLGLAVTPGAVWIANHWASPGDPTGSVMRIDPATNTVVKTILVGAATTSGPKFIAAAAGSIWVGVPNLQAVVRISTATDAIQATIPDKGTCASIAATDTSVWVAGGAGPGCAPGLTKIDTATNSVVGDKTNAGGNVGEVAIGFGSVWYTTFKSYFVGRIDPATAAVQSQLKLSAVPSGLGLGFGSAWVLDPADGLVLRLQPE
jgi:YVTN family beta-propeller protein